MKVLTKNKNSKYITDIGEAFIEVSPDGSKACLQAIINKTGKIITYCSFNPEQPFDLTEMDKKINYIMEQIQDINNRIDNISIGGSTEGNVYVGPENPNKNCIWYDTDTNDDFEKKS